MDHASQYRAVFTAQKPEENGIVTSPHSAFSPKIAPSDEFLLTALKGQLIGSTFELADELFGRETSKFQIDFPLTI
jgi:hypothetical protein